MILRLWSSWRDQGPPKDVDNGGLLDWETVTGLVDQAFRPNRRRKKQPAASTEPAAVLEPEASPPSQDTFTSLFTNL